jgi:cardiolipin synthase
LLSAAFFRLNFEVTATIADSQFASKIESMLQDDFSASTELTEYRLDDQSLWERLKARGSALLSPLL